MREQAKTPESSFQRAYLRQKKREREQVRVFRALLLVSFLVLWEVAADLRWIDPFIFSSPVRVGKTFVTLLTEQNLLRHIGITVYETGISFLLVSYTVIPIWRRRFCSISGSRCMRRESAFCSSRHLAWRSLCFCGSFRAFLR